MPDANQRSPGENANIVNIQGILHTFISHIFALPQVVSISLARQADNTVTLIANQLDDNVQGIEPINIIASVIGDLLGSAMSMPFSISNDLVISGTTSGLEIEQGETITITADMISTSDVDNADEVRFTVNNVLGGFFELVAHEGVAVKSFTLQNIGDGNVHFVHYGMDSPPTFDVSLSDSVATISAPATYSSMIPQTGLVAHFDAQNIDGDGDSSNQPANGATVRTWRDVSESNDTHHMGTILSPPLYVANVINGHGALTFFADDRYDRGLFINSGHTDIEGGDYIQKTFALLVKTGTNIDKFQVIYEQGNANVGYSFTVVNGHLYAGVWNRRDWDEGHQYKFIDLGAARENTVYSIVAVQDSSSLSDEANTFKAYLNGRFILELDHVDAQTAHGGDVSIGLTISSRYISDTLHPLSHEHVGHSTTHHQFVGYVGELLLYNYALSEDEIGSLTNYMVNKWNISFEPTATISKLELHKGGVVTITTDMINVDDFNHFADEIIFSVSNVVSGFFEHSNNLKTAIATFTLKDIQNGNIKFIHDGSLNTPSFEISFSDGVFTRDLVADITFSLISQVGLVAHFDAQNVDGDGDFSNQPVDGEVITTWTDISHSDHQHHAQQSLEDSRPTYRASAINSYSALQFDGLNDHFRINNHEDINTGSHIQKTLAVLIKTGIDISGFQVIYEQGNFLRGYNVVIANGRLYTGIWNKDWDAGHQYKFIDMGEAQENTAYTIVAIHDSSANSDANNIFKVYLDGVLVGQVDHVDAQVTHASSSIGHTTTHIINPANLEAVNHWEDSHFHGYIGEFLLYDRALSKDELGDLTEYMVNRWDIDLKPILTASNFKVGRGGSITVSADMIHATTFDDTDTLTFTVSGITYARFERTGSPGVAITSFTQAEIEQGSIHFIHDRSAHNPSFTIMVSDGTYESDALLANVIVNFRPTISLNTLEVGEGETITISSDIISAQDTNQGDTLTFTVSNITYARFERAGSPGVAITSFTQAEIEQGSIHFIHDGSVHNPSFTIMVSDGTYESDALLVSVIVNFRPTISLNTLEIGEGETITIGPDIISAQDTNQGDTLTFTVSDITYARFERAGSPGVAITSFTQAEIEQGSIHFIHDGSTRKPSFTIMVSDGTYESDALLASVIVNFRPTISLNTLEIGEGETITISSDIISAQDTNQGDTLTFTVSNITYARFERAGSPGVAITSFTQAEIEQGSIHFIHDGSVHNPSFTIMVSDGTYESNALLASVIVNFRPTISLNTLEVGEGETITISPDIISAQDTNQGDTLTFTVSSITYARFERTGSPGTAITSFTQAEIEQGSIHFIHDGSAHNPSFTIMVSDGTYTSDLLLVNVIVNSIPTIDFHPFEVGQGEAITIGPDIIIARDVDQEDTLTFTVSDVRYARFERAGSPGVAITSFTQTEFEQGSIRFTHDGSTRKPGFTIKVSDGINESEGLVIGVGVNFRPTISLNTLEVGQGETITISSDIISAQDANRGDTLTFTVFAIICSL